MNMPICPELAIAPVYSSGALKRFDAVCTDPDLADQLALALDIHFMPSKAGFGLDRKILVSDGVRLNTLHLHHHTSVVGGSDVPVLQVLIPLEDVIPHIVNGHSFASGEVCATYGQNFVGRFLGNGPPVLHIEIEQNILEANCSPAELESLKEIGHCYRARTSPDSLFDAQQRLSEMLFSLDTHVDRSGPVIVRAIMDLLFSDRSYQQEMHDRGQQAFDRVIALMHTGDWHLLRSIERLALDLGVSTKTLERKFLTNLGVSPKQATMSYRLFRARRSLLQDFSIEFVHKAAEQAGFKEMARFARSYRLAFGELPSETLARRDKSRIHLSQAS